MNKTALLLLFICCSLNNLNAQYSLVDTYFDGSKFLSITTNGYLLESTDGINWNENNFAIGSWTDIGYNNSNVHVIVGANTAYFKQGSNSWQASSLVPAGYWTSVIYDTINNLFVAVATSGPNYVMTSPDGNTWTARTPAYTWPHNDLAYADIAGTSRSVAVCQLGRGWIASDPTSTWSQINPGVLNDIRAITYGNGKFIWLEYDTYGAGGDRYRGMSTNGTSFSAATVNVRNKWSSMTYGAGKYVAVAEDSHSSYPNNRAAYSTDGDNWSYSNVVESNSWKSVAYGNSVFVAVSNTGTNRIMYSTDGIAWSHSINIITPNSTPTNISLTSSSVNENVATGTTIGALSTTDSDSGDTHTYSLVSGTGDTDNASFTISGANLLTNTALDYETKNSYSIVVQTSDGSATYSKTFTITVNDVDEDSDSDGITNNLDNCPSTANADQLDTDADGVGDVCDNAPNTPNADQTDTDGDGIGDVEDAFPLDATEWLDTDADGIGDNADMDDDEDGQLDTDEIACGSDPLLASSMSLDTDGDTIPDCVDTDDDNDGVIDTADAFPLDPAEWADTDADGIGNNADT